MSNNQTAFAGMFRAWAAILVGSAALGGPAAVRSDEPATLGTIERLDPAFDRLVPPEARVERVAEGFNWSEGTIWDLAGDRLLFSDVPENVVFQWTKAGGTSVSLKPSGYTGATARGGEPGSNGLTFDEQGRLVLCQHGDRRIARLEADGKFVTLADRYEGKRLNSPNDGVYKSNGDFYFTDPPYGLLGEGRDQGKELAFNGVYRLKPDGTLTLLTRELTFPNGLAFSPDEKTLYVAVSDPKHAVWMAYDVEEDGTLGKGRIFADVTASVPGRKGLPDGLKVDLAGNVFATGPGGVLVFAPDGKHLGTLATGEACGNCAWGEDGTVLYIASDMYLGRIQTATRGAMPGVARP
ncbi:SMP-30/gluconolactonase/LRE family protein [Paludisphaera soli]|uniref:SMP-30/gluconolactonase/LRE family protein n=1 Tax=Paludisphaera soli TaxID=2712865 RepID=UPI00197D37BE|nr:SMP-30/gluconolactonase/LRE family protein [Paludisphaera soli]